MVRQITKGLAVAGVALVLAFAASPAQADHFNPFSVEEGAIPGSLANLMTPLGQFNFNYTSQGLQTIVGGDSFAGVGDTFTENGSASVSAWINNNAAHDAHSPTQLNALEPTGYKVYALFDITGEADFGGSIDEIKGTFAPGANALTMWVDVLSDTVLNPDGTVASGGVDDLKLADADLISGESIIRCDAGTGCATAGDANGDFSGLFRITLTAFGQTVFVSPEPFYVLLDFSGNTSTITGDIACTGTQPCVTTASGAGNSFFLVEAVPHPASLLLMGASLLVMAGAAARRRIFKA